MKNLKLSGQITIIFFISFIITSLLLGVLIINMLDNIYENRVFEILESESKTLRLIDDIRSVEIKENISHIRYSSTDKAFNTSDNINAYLDEASIKLLINKATAQKENFARYKNIIKSRQIYYIVINYQGFFGIQNDDVFIILTDSTMKQEMVKTTAIQIFISCFIAFVLGYLIVILWITKLVNDTKKVTLSLDKMSENHYKTQIKTNRNDEIGELVANIELMRERIILDEKNKQETIQGVGHDLKTPIAIIQSYAEALDDGLCEPKQAAEVIINQSERLNDKVTKLLQLTRLGHIDAKNDSIIHSKMDELIKRIILSYSYRANVEIILNLDEVRFFGDVESWQIVIENIMDNAIRYAKSKIEINLRETELIISNDGKHIDENQLTYIFDAYKKSIDGKFGLGLSIVKKTCELFLFNIKAQNNADGVSFIISKKT